MTEKLVILSDMWGAKKGLWITSYLAFLRPYYEIVFLDSKDLANIDIPVHTEENIHQAFVDGGIDTAVAHLKSIVTEPCHFLTFSVGGSIVWKAALEGMPVKSITALSPTRLRTETRKPNVDEINLIYGENDPFKPTDDWFKKMRVEPQIVANFGHQLYSDEKISSCVCTDLLQKITRIAG